MKSLNLNSFDRKLAQRIYRLLTLIMHTTVKVKNATSSIRYSNQKTNCLPLPTHAGAIANLNANIIKPSYKTTTK